MVEDRWLALRLPSKRREHLRPARASLRTVPLCRTGDPRPYSSRALHARDGRRDAGESGLPGARRRADRDAVRAGPAAPFAPALERSDPSRRALEREALADDVRLPVR